MNDGSLVSFSRRSIGSTSGSAWLILEAASCDVDDLLRIRVKRRGHQIGGQDNAVPVADFAALRLGTIRHQDRQARLRAVGQQRHRDQPGGNHEERQREHGGAEQQARAADLDRPLGVAVEEQRVVAARRPGIDGGGVRN